MEIQKTISGTNAIALMRRLSREFNQSFMLVHQTWNDQKRETSGLRTVKRCMLRRSLPSDTFGNAIADLYLPYTDMDAPQNDQNRVCRKKLIRYVAFPPYFETIKVQWFNGN